MTAQFDLFPQPPAVHAGVPGFAIVENAIEPGQEADLAARIDEAPLAPFRFGQWTGKRLTCSYGSGYDYQRGKLTQAPPLPGWLGNLRDTIAPLVGVEPARIEQALLIRYDPGAGIGWHRDRPQYGEVMGLSLGAACVLRLRRRLADGFERHAIHLPPRSLYCLSGEARSLWEHSIAPIESTRRSITFRTLRS